MMIYKSLKAVRERERERESSNLENRKGITLIALVITIIVLLILAGVTISTLTGDNGLLTKAGEAKQVNEEVAALEKVKVEVAGSYGLDGEINLEQLKTNLKRLNISDEDITTKIKDGQETFPVTAKIDNYQYDILEDGTVDKHVDFETLESLYGKVVNNYTGYEATDVTEWKLLYVDEENRDAIIISSNQLSYRAIPSVSNSGVQYQGSANVRKYEYGINYNRLWLNQCVEESTKGNAKGTAYLCDPENWKQYKIGDSKYAAGGPTLEILIASFYNKQVKEFRNLEYTDNGYKIKEVNEIGYPKVIENGEMTTRVRNKLYNTGGKYWIASPGNDTFLRFLVDNGYVNYFWEGSSGIRPIVCLPASAIEVVGEGDNAVLNYK